MKFGIRNRSFVYPDGTGNIWQDTWSHIQRAEKDGFDSFWVMDHFYQLPVHGSVEEPFLDAWTVLPALAAVTNRIRLGAMVSPVGYRNPALLARMAASLEPKPLQKPHPPILIGGVGPKITLRIIAELGDACNLWGPPDEFIKQREMLKRHCDEVGRIDIVGEYERVGADHLCMDFAGNDRESMNCFLMRLCQNSRTNPKQSF